MFCKLQVRFAGEPSVWPGSSFLFLLFAMVFGVEPETPESVRERKGEPCLSSLPAHDFRVQETMISSLLGMFSHISRKAELL